MYAEFILILFDYFRTLKFRNFVFEIVIPLIGAILIFLLGRQYLYVDLRQLTKDFGDTTITLLGVLIGFSITVITIMHTSGNKNIEQIKKKNTDFKIGSNTVTLFQLVLINHTYSVILEVLCLIANLILFLVWAKVPGPHLKYWLSINLFFVLHILLLNVRNMADFYWIMFRKESN